MQVSRRSFLDAVGLGARAPLSAALIAARGREAALAAAVPLATADADEIRISSNENPLGPGRAAMEAFVRAFEDAGRYPTNARPSMADLREAIARRQAVRPENVSLGSGSKKTAMK